MNDHDFRWEAELRIPALTKGLSPEKQRYLLDFIHPQKFVPGMDDDLAAKTYGLDPADYRKIRKDSFSAARRAAAQLLEEPGFSQLVTGLPFEEEARIVALGDSITDFDFSWAEIFRNLLDLVWPRAGIRVLNAGISGETTAQILARLFPLKFYRPGWVICLAGTNDARTQGLQPGKVLVSPSETKENILEIRRYILEQVKARIIWLAPPPVREEAVKANWWLKELEMSWANRDLEVVREIIMGLPELTIDLSSSFLSSDQARLYLDDGVHPSLAGHKVIVRALIRQLTSP